MKSGSDYDAGIVPVPDVGPAAGASFGIVLAASVGSGIAHLGTSTMPFQVGALMDGAGLSASAAGLFGFFEVGALALSMILVSPLIYRFSAVLVSLFGVVLTASAHFIMFYTDPALPVLCFLAVVAGTGYGLIFSAMVTGVAGLPNADRIYALANGGALVLIVALMAALPSVSSRFGALGVFLGISVLILATAPAFAGFRGRRQVTGAQQRLPFWRPGVVQLLVVWAFFSLGTGAVWSFAERIGHKLELDAGTIGLILSVSTFCGISGTGIAALTAGRISRTHALIVGLVGTGCSCLLLSLAQGVVSYALGVLGYWVFYMYLYSYLLGTAAAFDRSGRVGTAGGGCERMGFALGAPLGGLLIDHLSLGMVGILGAVSCMGLMPFCLPAIHRALGNGR